MQLHIDLAGTTRKLGSRLPMSSTGMFIVAFSGLVVMRVACG